MPTTRLFNSNKKNTPILTESTLIKTCFMTHDSSDAKRSPVHASSTWHFLTFRITSQVFQSLLSRILCAAIQQRYSIVWCDGSRSRLYVSSRKPGTAQLLAQEKRLLAWRHAWEKYLFFNLFSDYKCRRANAFLKDASIKRRATLKCLSNLIDHSAPEARRGRGRIVLRKRGKGKIVLWKRARGGGERIVLRKSGLFVCFVFKAGKQCGLWPKEGCSLAKYAKFVLERLLFFGFLKSGMLVLLKAKFIVSFANGDGKHWT